MTSTVVADAEIRHLAKKLGLTTADRKEKLAPTIEDLEGLVATDDGASMGGLLAELLGLNIVGENNMGTTPTRGNTKIDALSECIEIQMEEIESLRMIEGKEMDVGLSLPLSVRVHINIDPSGDHRRAARFFAEVSLLLPRSYPLGTSKKCAPAIATNAYISPKADIDGKMSLSLVKHLSSSAERLRGSRGQLFELMEEARSWLDTNAKPVVTNILKAKKRRKSKSRSPTRKKRTGSIGSTGRSLATGSPKSSPSTPRSRSGSESKSSSKFSSERQQSSSPKTRLENLFVYRFAAEAFNVDLHVHSSISDLVSLGISRALAERYLGSCKWDSSRARALLLRDVALAVKDHRSPLSSSSSCLKPTISKCLACFEILKNGEGVRRMECQHVMCSECWRGYLRSCISNGQGTLRCPGEKCPCRLEDAFAMALMSNKDYSKYCRIKRRAYEIATGVVFCRSATCNRTVRSRTTAKSDFEPRTARCSCGERWCLRCKAELHHPVPCKTWKIYNESKVIQAKHNTFELKTVKYYERKPLFSTEVKCCPNCGHPWQKNGGCDHFTCGACRYEFWWCCLQPYGAHNNCRSFSDGVTEVKIYDDDTMNKDGYDIIDNMAGIFQKRSKKKIIIDRLSHSHLIESECLSRSKQEKLLEISNSPDQLKIIVDDLRGNRNRKDRHLDIRFIRRITLFLVDSHALLRAFYVFGINLDVQLESHEEASKMFEQVHIMEYFVDSLDNVMLIMPWMEKRSKRDADQISLLVMSIKQSATKALGLVSSVILSIHKRKVLTNSLWEKHWRVQDARLKEVLATYESET